MIIKTYNTSAEEKILLKHYMIKTKLATKVMFKGYGRDLMSENYCKW